MSSRRHKMLPSSLTCATLITFALLTIVNAEPFGCQNEPFEFGSSDAKHLTCRVKSFDYLYAGSTLRAVPNRHTVSLAIRCQPDELVESSVMNNSFSHLNELQHLSIEDCKLATLPSAAFGGLGGLKSLTIRSRNEQWDRPIELTIPQSLFAHLGQLERIDLSQNSMTHVPEGSFCDLPLLSALNFSSNAFTEMHSFGFSTRNRDARSMCKVDTLTELDISYNQLKVLTDRGLTVLKRLQLLNLSHNKITRAEEMAMVGLSSLQTLDLSNNELVALTPRFMNPIADTLVELRLTNNSISVLPPGLFAGLKSLRLLDLSHNQIPSYWITETTFQGTTKLETLDLSYNKLIRIDSRTFKMQTSLENLHLHHNEIETIFGGAFDSLSKLQSLTLGHNRLTQIAADSFSGLPGLMLLSIEENHIETIHDDALANISSLFELYLKNNRLRVVPDAIKHLQELRVLDLCNNRIEDIGNTSYKGLPNLYSLQLEGNKIGNLTKGHFLELPNLRVLNLARNQIRGIEQGSFDVVGDLHALRLDSNQLVDINGLFTNLRDLLMLNISDNHIQWFDFALIPVGLQWLSVRGNQIETVGNYFELESLLRMRTLDLSNNRITDVEASSLPAGIEIVYLQNNRIKRIQPFTFVEKHNLTRVDLSGNQLSTVEMSAFRLSKARMAKTLPEFYIANNPYQCDCNMEWLRNIHVEDESRLYPRFADADRVQCHLTFAKDKTQMVALKDTDPARFLCSYKSHCFALCHCCDFDACDCEMTCPDNCTCYYDKSWNTNVVDCSAQRHVVVPPRIPMDVTELYLDGNDITTLSSHTFIGRKNLKVLHLNNSLITTINNRTFNGLKTLQILNLNHNRLVQLHGYEFERLVDLKELYLSYNRLSTIANNTFLALRSLRVLHLDHNYIIEFHVWNLNYNGNLRDLRLSHNMWSCECSYIDKYLQWLPRKRAIISDLGDVQCFFNETTGLTLTSDFNMSMCTQFSPNSKVFGAQQFQVQDLVPVVVGGAAIVALIVISLIVVLIYRHEMSVWFYSKYGVRLHGRASSRREEEKLFDAFVSYSKKDEAFVSQILAPEMEYGSPPFRLCLHYRDLPVASGYLSDAIVEAMEASRRSMLIISENFLKGEWCRYEFKSAHLDVLRSNPNHKLILIFIGKVNTKDFDPDIRYWLKTQTYLQWGERQFWQKLRYAMPDVAFARKPPPCLEQTRDLTMAVHI